MNFDQWFQQELQAGRLHAADEKVARPAWEAAQKIMLPAPVYEDSRISGSIAAQFSERGESA